MKIKTSDELVFIETNRWQRFKFLPKANLTGAKSVSQSEQMANDEFGICATVDRRRKSFAKQNSTGAKVNQSTVTIQTFGKINTRFWKF